MTATLLRRALELTFMIVVGAGLVLSSCGTARADVVISNLGQTTPGRVPSSYVGAAFMNGSAEFVQSVQISQTVEGATPGEYLTLNARNSDGTIGAALLGFVTESTAAGLTNFSPVSSFILGANTSYWVVLHSASAANVNWDYTSSDAYTSENGSIMLASNGDYSVAITKGPQVYRLSGTPVLPRAIPESGATLLYLAIAGLPLVTLRIRRLRQSQ